MKDTSVCFLDSSELYVLVCIHCIYLGGFPIYFIVYVCYAFWRDLLICIVYVCCIFWRDLLIFFSTQIMSTSVTFHGMVSLFISIVYVCCTFWKRYLLFHLFNFFEIHLSSMCLTTSLTCAVSYVFAVYTLVPFFQRDLLIFFSTHRSCLHPVQFTGCFPYLFSMYNFVTLFERCIFFFLNSFQLSVLVYIRYRCFVFSLFTCICIVYICYTFWKSYLVLFFFKHTNFVNIRYISLDCFPI